MQEFLRSFMELISPALQIVIQVFLVTLAAQVSAWLVKKYQFASSRLSVDQRYLLSSVVESAVKAAKQTLDNNEQKLQYAFEIVQKSLLSYGIKLDPAIIYAAIEAEVFDTKPEVEKMEDKVNG